MKQEVVTGTICL